MDQTGSPDSQNERKHGERNSSSMRQRNRGRNAPDLDSLERGRLLVTQRSAPARHIGVASESVLPQHHPLPGIAPTNTVDRDHEHAPDANISTPRAPTNQRWPGSNFKIEQVLPGSVYLWACGERDEGDITSTVSRPESAAAWVVLLAQLMCYAGLWHVSGNQPSVESQSASTPDANTQERPDFSILAIAGAMFLLLFIAAADLWAGVALCTEGRDSGDSWYWQRKAFGVSLMGTFVALIGSSVRVLFYSSFENVELVIGAAAVLFIADVDEKAMGLLKNVAGKWRLFWVFQGIGLSFMLAVLAIKATGNGTTVHSRGSDGEDGDLFGLYDWHFILSIHPNTVTVFALLATNVISTPKSSLTARILCPSSFGWLGFLFLMIGWVLMGGVDWFWYHLYYFEAFPVFYKFTVQLVAGLPVVFGAFWNRQELRSQLKDGIQRSAGDCCTQKYLLWSGVLLLVLDIGGSYVEHNLGFSYKRDYPDDAWYFHMWLFLEALWWGAAELWLILGMHAAGTRTGGITTFSVPRVRWMLLAWGFSEGGYALSLSYVIDAYIAAPVRLWAVNHLWALPLSLFCDFMLRGMGWVLLVGTFLWGEKPGTYGVAFWASATFVRDSVVYCVGIWVSSWGLGTVK